MRQIRNEMRLSLVVAACGLLLAACGGGGSDEEGGKLQTISFNYPGGKTLALLPSDGASPAVTSTELATIELVATADSGLPVTFVSNTPGICAVSGSTVTLLVSGECSITATQGGGQGYAPALATSQLFVIPKYQQAIAMVNPGWQPLDAQTFTVPAASTIGKPVTLASTTPDVCTVSGTTVSKVANGQCVIEATEPGGANWAMAKSSKTIPIGTATAPLLPFASGYKDTGSTAEFGKVNASAGSSLHGWYCPSAPECGSSLGGTTVTVHPTNGSADFLSYSTFMHYFHVQEANARALGFGAYDNFTVWAPGLTADLNPSSNTNGGVAIESQAALVIEDVAQNDEWHSTSNPKINVDVVLGMFNIRTTGNDAGKGCNVKLRGVITPATAAATKYTLPLRGLKVQDACDLGFTDADVWTVLQASTIVQINIFPDDINSYNARRDSSGAFVNFPTELTVGAIYIQ